METRLKQVLQRHRILWGALLLTTVLYMAIAEYLGSNGQFPAGGLAPSVAAVLAVAALVSAVASVFVPRLFIARLMDRLTLQTVSRADGGADGRSFREAAAARIALEDPIAARIAVARAIQAPFILGLACTEAVVLCGLVSAFMGATRSFAVGFWIVGWMLFATKFPTEGKLDAAIRRHFRGAVA